jgi:TonB family protein
MVGRAWRARAIGGAAMAVALLASIEASAQTKPTLTPPKLHDPASVESAPFPEEAQKAGVSGAVLLQLDIDATGAVTDARVLEPAGHGFDEAALGAAKKLVFDPATKDGKPIASKLNYRFTFTWKAPDPPAPKDPPKEPAKLAKGELRVTVRIASSDGPLAGVAKVEVRALAAPGAAPGAPVAALTPAVSHQVGDDGVVTIPELAPGRYHVVIAAPGFVGAQADEEITAGNRTEVTYRLAPEAVAADASEQTLEVRGERPPREVTVHSLDQRELSRIPGTNGDAIRGVQSMPGVARSRGLGQQLIIRGSAPQDTQVFIDGIAIPLVYHFGGLSSVVPTEMIDRLEFRPGNFGAEYGRVMGGVIDVRTLGAPTDGKFHALAQADFIDSRFVAKGPIPLLDGWSFVAGARRSYMDLWLTPLLSRRGGGFTATPVYYDWQGFVEHRGANHSVLRIGFFGADDNLRIIRDTVNTRDPAESNDVDLHTGFGRLTASYDVDLSPTVHFHDVAAYGWDIRSFDSGTRQFKVTARPLVDRGELAIKIAKGFTMNLGLDVTYTTTTYDVTAPPPRQPGEPAGGASQQLLTETSAPTFFLPALYSELEMQLTKRLRVVEGFRFDYNGATKHADASPRVSFRYALVQGKEAGDDELAVKGGFGVFRQPPQPQEISAVFGTPGLYSSRALHYSLGLEQKLQHRFNLSAEGFYKSLDSLVARTPSSDGTYAYTNLGSGNVYGLEVLLRYNADERFFGWIAYTLSRSTRQKGPDQPETLFQYDQTHILTVLGSYRIGGGWELGARWRFVSGNLFTPCNGGAQNGASGSYTCLSGPSFSTRLPPFHQLDIRLDKHWYFKQWQLSAYLDVQNAYNRGNAEGIAYNFDYSQHIYQTGLPIIPSLGIRGEL